MYNNLFFLNKIDILKNLLNKDNLNLKRIQDEVEEVARFYDVQKYNYLEDLLDPRRYGVKVPNQIPLPSCTFTFKKNITLATNSKGAILIKYNPFFLCDTNIYEISFKNKYLNKYNDIRFPSTFWTADKFMDTIDMPSLTTNFASRGIDMVLPTGIYSQYRLVSASIKVSYQGPLESASGTIGGTPVFFKDYSVGGRYSSTDQPEINPSGPSYNVISGGGEFFDYKNIISQPYYKEGTCLNKLYMTYFPVDNTFFEFVRFPRKKDVMVTNYQYLNYYNPHWVYTSSSCYKTGFYWIIAIKELPPSSSCVRCELVSNFECLPTEEFLNYAPISNYYYALNKQDMTDVISRVKEDCVQIL